MTSKRLFILTIRIDSFYVIQEMMDAKRRFDAAQALFSSEAHKQDQISINSGDWKTLWSMARKYYEEFIYP